jgi:hypothetical protein
LRQRFFNFLLFSLLETQTQVARDREQREQQVMATLEMMSLFKLHVQQVPRNAMHVASLTCINNFVAEPERRGEALWRYSGRDQPVMRLLLDEAVGVVETPSRQAASDK